MFNEDLVFDSGDTTANASDAARGPQRARYDCSRQMSHCRCALSGRYRAGRELFDYRHAVASLESRAGVVQID